MKLNAILAFATLAFATGGLSSPETAPDIHARKVGGKCKHSSTPGSCQKTKDCANTYGWYSNNACPDDPTDVKCCSYSECRKGDKFGQCLNNNAANKNICAGGKWYKNLCPGGADVQCCILN